MIKALSAAFALGLMTVAAGGASATVLFSQNFNGYTGAANGTQAVTGLQMFHNGVIPGATGNTYADMIQAVQRAPGDFAVMLYDYNTIDLGVFQGGNVLGQRYTVSFRDAPAAGTTAATGTSTSDVVRFILSDASGYVSYYDDAPGSFPRGDTNAFRDVSFDYIGNGNGEAHFSIQNPNSVGRFGGAIDDIVISTASVPEPMSIALLGAGLAGVSLVRRRKAA